MNPNRKAARKILERVAQKECGLSLDDLPDLPCIMNALDEMEEMIGEEEPILTADLLNIAQDAIFELMEEEGMMLD